MAVAMDGNGRAGMRFDKNGGTGFRPNCLLAAKRASMRNAQLKLTTEGDLEGKLTVTFTGLEALDRRIRQRNEDETRRRKIWKTK
jgi:hypothetical protein